MISGSKLKFPLISAAIFIAINGALFGPSFFKRGQIVGGTDTVTQVIPWFVFAARELRAGHLPLWNPYTFCGTPFVANISTALFYPGNWIVLFLPIRICIDLIFAFHFFLAGWLMSLWCKSRGISGVASVMAGVLYSLNAPFLGHLSAGHTWIIEVMAWAPLIFMSIDKLLDEPTLRWFLIGSMAVALSILAAHAQMVYYTGLIAGLYAALRLVGMLINSRSNDAIKKSAILKAALVVFSIYLAGGAIGAIELIPVTNTAQETVRANGLNYDMASSANVPPEGLLTLISPSVLGSMRLTDSSTLPFFGRWYPIESIIFVGVICLALASFGAVRGEKKSRRFMAALAVVCFVLMLGNTTPIYDQLYHYFPMYGSFRSTSRFSFLFALFLAVLAGAGFDQLVKQRAVPRAYLITLIVSAVVIASASAWLHHEIGRESAGSWGAMLRSFPASQLPTLNPDALRDPDLVRRSGLHAVNMLLIPAGLLVCASLALVLMRYWPRAAYVLAVLAVAEILVFAWQNIPMVQMVMSYPPDWEKTIAQFGTEDRVISTSMGYANLGVARGYQDAYGYDPLVLTRYADFLGAIQEDVMPQEKEAIQAGLNWCPPIYLELKPGPIDPKGNPFVLSKRLSFLRPTRIFGGVLQPGAHGLTGVNIRIIPSLHRLELLSNVEIETTRDRILAGIDENSFDPGKTVILESQPNPKPLASVTGRSAGAVTATDIDTDSMEITADLNRPQVLLITESYAADWKARPISTNPNQASYTVMPADYAYRAIPLAAGHHDFILEYKPASVTWGRYITLATMAGWLVAGLWMVTRRAKGAEEPPRASQEQDGSTDAPTLKVKTATIASTPEPVVKKPAAPVAKPVPAAPKTVAAPTPPKPAPVPAKPIAAPPKPTPTPPKPAPAPPGFTAIRSTRPPLRKSPNKPGEEPKNPPAGPVA